MDPDQPAPPPKLLIRHMLRLGSGLLACAALLDLLREAFSGGSWRAIPGLAEAYVMVLTAYTGTREWEKWTDPQAHDSQRTSLGLSGPGDCRPQDQTSYRGQWFVLAWIAFPVFLWLCDILNWAAPVWPSSLNKTFACVLTAYVGGKASGRWRQSLRHAFALKSTRQSPPISPELLLARHTLRLGSSLLGLASLIDVAVEGFSGGEWRFTGSLIPCYALVLAAYAATREWEKWTDPYDQDAYWGQWFVLAWCVLAFALGLSSVMGAWTVWPASLNTALAAVLGVFAGSKVSGMYRASKKKEAAGTAAPAPVPVPTKPVPDAPLGEKERVAQACKKLGTFTFGQIIDDTGIPLFSVRGQIGWLVKSGKVVKVEKDIYKWVGD